MTLRRALLLDTATLRAGLLPLFTPASVECVRECARRNVARQANLCRNHRDRITAVGGRSSLPTLPHPVQQVEPRGAGHRSMQQHRAAGGEVLADRRVLRASACWVIAEPYYAAMSWADDSWSAVFQDLRVEAEAWLQEASAHGSAVTTVVLPQHERRESQQAPQARLAALRVGYRGLGRPAVCSPDVARRRPPCAPRTHRAPPR